MTQRPPALELGPESAGIAPGRGRLAGRKIMVVGGGQRVFDEASDPIGNGRAMCQLFAREGARVAVADANGDAAAETLVRITAEGGGGVTIVGDVRSEADVARMFDEAEKALGGIDGVVFNVGIFGGVGLGRPLSEWDEIIDVNLRGAMLVGREAVARMGPRGSLVLTSSIAGYKPGSQMVAYDVSKAGLGGVMRFLAQVAAARDIRVNTVIPGLVDTPNGRSAGAGRPSRGKGENLPFRRQATGWEIAYAALFFMSDESAYVTAQHLAVDCGLMGMT